MSTATAIKERPVIFSGPMVRALLEGRKTQTRRVVKPQPDRDPCECHYSPSGWALEGIANEHGIKGCSCVEIKCPYGQPGDRLWVREAHSFWVAGQHPNWVVDSINYAADNPGLDPFEGCRIGKRLDPKVSFVGGIRRGWRPSIQMPRWASRITLEITEVRVERLQAISEADKLAEGATPEVPFGTVWRKINTKPGIRWEDNPWVWAISFLRVEAKP